MCVLKTSAGFDTRYLAYVLVKLKERHLEQTSCTGLALTAARDIVTTYNLLICVLGINFHLLFWSFST